MYLALIPDVKSEEAIRRAVPSCGELHLTVIHTTAKIALPDDAVFRSYQAHVARHGIYCAVLGTIRVGGTSRRMWALKLAIPPGIREYGERELGKPGVGWSKQWPFNPHITLCEAPALTLAEELPSTVVFDRMEWRP